MMTLKETFQTADALANMLGAGMNMTRALERLQRLQPRHSAFWVSARERVQDGRPLSDSFGEIWPMDLVNAIKAGESSGMLVEVFERIAQTTELRLKIRAIMWKLAYPVGWGLGGVVVFILYMLFVLPSISMATGQESESTMMQLSRWLSDYIDNHWIITLILMTGAILALVAWLRTPEVQSSLLDASLQVPYLGEGFRDLYFGLWAQYMAMMAYSGLPTTTGLALTESILPGAMRDSVSRFRHDLEVLNLSLSDAADPAKQKADDERVRWWPFYISQAFIIADSTGHIDAALMKVAPALIKEGSTRLERAIQVGNAMAIALAAMLITAPIAAYYIEMASVMNQSGL